MLDRPFQPGEGVGLLEPKPIKIKVRDPEAWYPLCIKRYTMEHMSATKEEWLALANEFSKQKSPALAEWCRRKACYGR